MRRVLAALAVVSLVLVPVRSRASPPILDLGRLDDAILELEKRTKDEGYKSRLERHPVPRLFDMYRSLSRRVARSAPAAKKAEKPAEKPAKAGDTVTLRRHPAHGRERLAEISGVVPSLYDLPDGCTFHPRCPEAEKICRRQVPQMQDAGGGRRVRCWRRGH